jgi:hypothetical protein
MPSAPNRLPRLSSAPPSPAPQAAALTLAPSPPQPHSLSAPSPEQAAALTLGIFLALTTFTLQSRYDWSWLGPVLFAGVFILLLWSFFTFWLMPFNGFRWQMVLSLLFALLFVGFIIYDTHMIMKYFGVDDFVIAAIELYLDVVNLFLFLLSFLSGSSN